MTTRREKAVLNSTTRRLASWSQGVQSECTEVNFFCVEKRSSLSGVDCVMRSIQQGV